CEPNKPFQLGPTLPTVEPSTEWQATQPIRLASFCPSSTVTGVERTRAGLGVKSTVIRSKPSFFGSNGVSAYGVSQAFCAKVVPARVARAQPTRICITGFILGIPTKTALRSRDK